MLELIRHSCRKIYVQRFADEAHVSSTPAPADIIGLQDLFSSSYIRMTYVAQDSLSRYSVSFWNVYNTTIYADETNLRSKEH